MTVCGKHRKERHHTTGASNRSKSWKRTDGPIDFDASMRSTLPRQMKHDKDRHVPATTIGTGNSDFHQKLPGHDYRQPGADARVTQTIRRETRLREDAEDMDRTNRMPTTITAPARSLDVPKEPRQQGFKAGPRYGAKHWFDTPSYERQPLQKDEGQTWNHLESHKVQGDRKAQDSMMRSMRGPEDLDTAPAEMGGTSHPLDVDREEYYPGRSLIDAVDDQPSNNFQVRPIHMPDFHDPPPADADPVMRMQRIREMIRQRYAGRPGLIGVFRACTLTKPGVVFPKDLQTILDQMGLRTSDRECEMLVEAVDKDHKGAISFDEFADLIYGQRVNVGGPKHEASERHVRHVTKTLVDNLISNGQGLGKAFSEVDYERRYLINKEQFANALGSACNHMSNQAVEFLWASQFQGQADEDLDSRCIDWRSFMNQLAHFAHDHRAPTPTCVQGRKRQYDLLQRTAALTGGNLLDLELNRPDQNADDEVHIVADQLRHRASKLLYRPRDAALLSESFVEEVRHKASRTVESLPQRIPKSRLTELLKNRQAVKQDELIDLLCAELDQPNAPSPLEPEVPRYALASGSAEEGPVREHAGAGRADATLGGFSGPACLKLVRADIEAYVYSQRHNRDYEVDVDQFIDHVYKLPDERKAIDVLNDGLNRQKRMNRPGRERPPNTEEPRFENFQQAMHAMEEMSDAIAAVESSNGGNVRPFRMFQVLDMDGDGYITLTDLRKAFKKYKIPHNEGDLHAVFSELDRNDDGSVEIGEFSRNFITSQGCMLANMQKPIKAVLHEGGVETGGPLADLAEERERAKEQTQRLFAQPDAAPPPSGGSGSDAGRSRSAPCSAGSGRSQMGRTGASVIAPVITETGPRGPGRISDVIRSRTSSWKPVRSELFTSIPKTRYGMTCYPDTRHVTEPSVPHAGSFLHDGARFKTTKHAKSIFAAPDHLDPQHSDAMKKRASSEFRVERIRQRQRDFNERCFAANEAAREFDELKVARKAMNQLNYERRCQMSCS